MIKKQGMFQYYFYSLERKANLASGQKTCFHTSFQILIIILREEDANLLDNTNSD